MKNCFCLLAFAALLLGSCTQERVAKTTPAPHYELTDLDRMFNEVSTEMDNFVKVHEAEPFCAEMFIWTSDKSEDTERPTVRLSPTFGYLSSSKDVSLIIERRTAPDDGTSLQYALVRCNNIGRPGYTYHVEVEVTEYSATDDLRKKDVEYVFSKSQMRHAYQPFFDRLDEARTQKQAIAFPRALGGIDKLAKNG